MFFYVDVLNALLLHCMPFECVYDKETPTGQLANFGGFVNATMPAFRKAYAIENWHRLVEKTGCIRKKRGGTFAEPTSFSGDSSLEPGSLLKYVQKVFIEMCRKVREKLCCMEVPDTADANGRKRYTFQVRIGVDSSLLFSHCPILAG